MDWWGVLLAIAAPGGIVVALIERMRKENTRDHAVNTAILERIDSKVDRIDDRLDHHIEWHLEKDR